MQHLSLKSKSQHLPFYLVFGASVLIYFFLTRTLLLKGIEEAEIDTIIQMALIGISIIWALSVLLLWMQLRKSLAQQKKLQKWLLSIAPLLVLPLVGFMLIVIGLVEQFFA